ncbi:hypothetical protein PIB30_091247 [Stylosanthes scabra]|uniref:Putative plant transposon protein domain-containing protein n=1 Tax=Stylosanthes scabra TaxID=79078 RepID=A0ABU6QVJ0_9FABA|nr:hypothetical protein [Stylosanthes scabra]
MASSSANYDAHHFKSPFHQKLFEEHAANKSVTPETKFDLEEDQHPEIEEQIANRGWKRLTNPRTKISKLLIQVFYTNAARTEEEIKDAEAQPYKSYVRCVEIYFLQKNIRQVLRLRDQTSGAETDFNNRQRIDQRLTPLARWKMSSSQLNQQIQLKRQDLTPLARGWHEFIIYSIIPTGNKSEITIARAILIHSIINGEDVRAEELIADNIAIIVLGVQGKGKLAFPSTIHRLCKAAENNFGEQQQQGIQKINEGLANLKIQQEMFFESMQNTQAQYLEELKELKTRQDDLWSNQNNFYHRMRIEQEKTIKEIEEIKKFQVNTDGLSQRSY